MKKHVKISMLKSSYLFFKEIVNLIPELGYVKPVSFDNMP